MGFLELQNVPEVSFGANTLGSNVWAAILFWRHPYKCSTTILYDMDLKESLIIENLYNGNREV